MHNMFRAKHPHAAPVTTILHIAGSVACSHGNGISHHGFDCCRACLPSSSWPSRGRECVGSRVVTAESESGSRNQSTSERDRAQLRPSDDKQVA